MHKKIKIDHEINYGSQIYKVYFKRKNEVYIHEDIHVATINQLF